MPGEQLRPQGPEKQHKPENEQFDSEALRQKIEREYSAETPDDKIETEGARAEVAEALQAHEEQPQATAEKEVAPAQEAVISPAQKEVAFQQTMVNLQKDMSAPSRSFSKFIHTPAVENASEVAGQTIARPNSILFGSLGAFIVTLGVYLLAKYNGFRLSGSEFIIMFILGWFAGLIIDLLRKIVTGKT